VIDDVRRRVQQTVTGHRGCKTDPLYRIQKLLLKACDDLDNQGWRRLAEGLRPAAPTARSPPPGSLKEITRDLHRADGAGCA
jgi:hypothetical protein